MHMSPVVGNSKTDNIFPFNFNFITSPWDVCMSLVVPWEGHKTKPAVTFKYKFTSME